MNCKVSLYIATALVALATGGQAQAALTLPAGDLFLNGTFEFRWGGGGSARIDPALYVGGNAAFPTGLDTVYLPPGDVASATALTFGYAVEGADSGTLQLTYMVNNPSVETWHGLRFIADVSGDPFDDAIEQVSVHGPGGASGDPAHYGIDDFDSGDLFLNDILNSAQLDDSDGCAGAPCPAEAALQWNLDQLAPGETWIISIALSDEGTRVSTRWLEFLSFSAVPVAPLGPEVLSFSGEALVVPLPGALLFAASALVPLFGHRRRRN